MRMEEGSRSQDSRHRQCVLTDENGPDGEGDAANLVSGSSGQQYASRHLTQQPRCAHPFLSTLVLSRLSSMP
jgi:hypothetical protein